MQDAVQPHGKVPIPTGSAAIIGNFNLSAQMPNGRTMNVAGYLYEGEDEASVNDRIDMLSSVMERQRKRMEVPELEVKLDQLERGLVQQLEAYNAILTRQQDGKKIPSADASHLKQYPVTIKHIESEIEKGKKAIEDAKIAGGLA